jgi:cytoskeleton protein RodZ
MQMTLETIGQKLKAAREAQGLSLRQIYERTKIPINHLQAIDTGVSDDLPEPVYVAGFIKRYAECIGLDGQVLADEYRRMDGATDGNGKPKAAGPQQVYVTPEYLKHARIDNRPPTYKLWPFYVVAIVVLMVVLSWYSTQQSQTAQQPDPYNLSLKDSAAQLGSQSGINAATPNATGTGTANGAPATPQDDKVILSASQHVWVEVKKLSSGESIFTGYLEQGDRREFSDSQGLRIRAGNGGSISTEFKGKIEAFGVPGKVAERTFATTNAVASTDPASTTDGTSTASSTATTAATTVAATKPKKVRKTESTGLASGYRSIYDSGSRSISRDGGTRSIDVPYRYSEGRLDSD